MAIKMDRTGIIVSAVVGSLGLLSAILGFSAEGTKLTPYTILVYGDQCIYPQNPALALGVCATIFLLVAQITISAVGGCCGCCKSRAIPSETKRIVGIICAVFSWIAALTACVLLLEGASWNANVVRETAPDCYYLKDGVFAGAGVLTLAAAALGITSFIMLRRQPATAAPAVAAGGQPLGAGIAMGHPQFPPAAGAGAQSKPSEQPPPAGIAIGHQQFPPSSSPQYPSNPQGYGQAQVAPTASHPQGYGGQAPQNPQFPPHLPAHQGYGPHAPIQPSSHSQGHPAGAAPPAAAGAPEPGQQPPPSGVPMCHGHPHNPQYPSSPQGYGQAQVAPPASHPQWYGQAPQYPCQPELSMQVPVPPTSPPPQG
ncbi:uncharacterized protein LOC133884950 [Phragmites australis]|uniref:uncharacterized protein LOC133884950 n=1 Tax=Phragmites australis TaxID=29695 RepID=UPI002D77AF85|nr:uncharacterized protein LOC133884950 [Phragmites australis]